MNKLAFFLLPIIFTCFSSFGQERANEARPQLQLSMDGQSEKLTNVMGWSKLENSDGYYWQKSNLNSEFSYLPCCADWVRFKSIQNFKFTLEGKKFYLFVIEYYEGIKTYAIKSENVDLLLNRINFADGQSFQGLPIEFSRYFSGENLKSFDPEQSIKHRELIIKLLMNKDEYLGGGSNANSSGDMLFYYLNSQLLKGESIVRFIVTPWSIIGTGIIKTPSNNYFELKKDDFLKLFKFTAFIGETSSMILGQQKRLSGDFQGAIDEFSKAISVNPNNEYYYTQRAISKMKLNDYQGAESDLTKAQEVLNINKSKNSNYYNTDLTEEDILESFANVKFLQGKYDEAIEYCNKILNEFWSDQTKARVYFLKAKIEIKAEKNDQLICQDLLMAKQLGVSGKEINAHISEYCKINLEGTNQEKDYWVLVLDSFTDENSALQKQKEIQRIFNFTTEIKTIKQSEWGTERSTLIYRIIAGKNLTEGEAVKLANRIRVIGNMPDVKYEKIWE